jgi:hypothetical protein
MENCNLGRALRALHESAPKGPLSNREIARRCGVSHVAIGKIANAALAKLRAQFADSDLPDLIGILNSPATGGLHEWCEILPFQSPKDRKVREARSVLQDAPSLPPMEVLPDRPPTHRRLRPWFRRRAF